MLDQTQPNDLQSVLRPRGNHVQSQYITYQKEIHYEIIASSLHNQEINSPKEIMKDDNLERRVRTDQREDCKVDQQEAEMIDHHFLLHQNVSILFSMGQISLQSVIITADELEGLVKSGIDCEKSHFWIGCRGNFNLLLILNRNYL